MTIRWIRIITFVPFILARKNKKLMRLQGHPSSSEQAPALPDERVCSLVPKAMPQLVPTMLSLLKAIEPEIIYAGYDSTIPDTSTRLMTTLNRLGGRQVVSAVKWAKALPGESSILADIRLIITQTFVLFWKIIFPFIPVKQL